MKDLCQLYKIVERGVKDLKRKKSQMILIKNKYKLKLQSKKAPNSNDDYSGVK